MASNGTIDFDRLVVLHNPQSSNAHKATKLISALQAAYPDRVVVITIGKTAASNLALLKNNLRAGDILIPCGGDGTISGVVDCLLDQAMPAALRRTPVLPVGTGRMNDVARMLNGRYAANPLYVLKHGRALSVYPFECTCTPLDGKGKPVTKTVIYNIGFGYSGAGSEVLNDPGFRAKLQGRTSVSRTVEFFKLGASVLKDAEYFDITHNGERRSVLEVMIANGNMLGGFYRLPTRLSQREFYFTISDDKSFLRTVRTVAELVTNTFSGGVRTKSASFTLHNQVIAQLGGEPFTPPTPCEVSVTLHKEPIIMLATNPDA